MRKTAALFTLLALTLSLCACKNTAARWQEQYDLGMWYLSDGEYEEAIIVFNAAIEIDPTQADAYLSLANAYIGMNDFDAAREILEQGYELTQSEALKAKLEELDSGNIFDFWGNPRKRSGYDGSGNLKWYHIYEYDKKQTVSVTTYNASGVQTGFWDGFRYDEEGRELISMVYDDGGVIFGTVESVYDEQGRVIRVNAFDLDGLSQGYNIDEYDEAGNLIHRYVYDGEGELQFDDQFVFDGDRCIGLEEYGSEGTLLFRVEYRYDEQGRLTDIIEYGADGALIYREEYRYDEQGRHVIYYGSGGEVLGEEVLEY